MLGATIAQGSNGEVDERVKRLEFGSSPRFSPMTFKVATLLPLLYSTLKKCFMTNKIIYNI